ncbi:hypothetical protein AB6A40_001732 [Gnathostoma spinigerum]|uniref:Biogenesis of lysosome-related organelles complex 1 subunit 3 n=1 Tax=Gnathostoma spinigerum TaxID=75299 RepID=A0ABD6E4U7_9BILA
MSSENVLIAGEASETDDDEVTGNEKSIVESEKASHQSTRVPQCDGILDKSVTKRPWSVHVDEKLEQRWKSLGYDAIFLEARRGSMINKNMANLRQSISQTYETLQSVSYNVQHAVECLGKLETDLPLLLDAMNSLNLKTNSP